MRACGAFPADMRNGMRMSVCLRRGNAGRKPGWKWTSDRCLRFIPISMTGKSRPRASGSGVRKGADNSGPVRTRLQSAFSLWRICQRQWPFPRICWSVSSLRLSSVRIGSCNGCIPADADDRIRGGETGSFQYPVMNL